MTRWLRANASLLVVGAVALIGFASHPVATTRSRFAVLAACLLILYGAYWSDGAAPRVTRRLLRAIALTIGLFCLLAIAPPLGFTPIDVLPAWITVGVGAVVVAAVAVPALRGRRPQVAIGGALIVFVSIAGFVHISNTADLSTDVIYGHREAARALADGANPYADIRFPDTAPDHANVGMIEGYAYPPVTLAPYVVAEWLGDARWAGVAAIAITMAVVLHVGSRREGLGLLLVGLGLTHPMLGAIFAHGWTESLSSMLVVLAAVAVRHTVIGGILSGLSIASKQYMAITAAPLVSMPRPERWRQTAIAVGVAALTVAPFLLWDPAAFWQSQVGFQLGRVQRFDTLSVAWLVRVPILVALALSIAIGLLLGTRTRSRSGLLLAQAAPLAVYFTLSPNSFRNYFFIVSLMLVAAIALASDDAPGVDADSLAGGETGEAAGVRGGRSAGGDGWLP